MKKILLFTILFSSLINIEFSIAQDMDEFDIQSKNGEDCCNNQGEGNYQFGNSDFSSINAYLYAISRTKDEWRAWVKKQEEILKIEIEKNYGYEFDNFKEASFKIFKDNAGKYGSSLKNTFIKVEDKPQYHNSIENKKLNLIELQHLKIRRNELEKGNINNSIFTFSKANGVFLRDIKDFTKLNSTERDVKNHYSVNKATEHTAAKFNNLLTNFNSDKYGEYMSEIIEGYWDDINIGERTWIVQYFVNLDKLNRNRTNFVEIQPTIEIEKALLNLLFSIPWGNNKEHILGFIWENMTMSIFDLNYWETLYWQKVNNYHLPYSLIRHHDRVKFKNQSIDEANTIREDAFSDLLNQFTEKDILADLKIIGLGKDNNTFLDARPNLRVQIAEYFKINDFSQVSHNAINYLLNQYREGKKFIVDTEVYKSIYPSALNDSNNPDRALSFCFDKDAANDGLPGFGNVLVKFFDEVKDNNYKGFIIREMFAARGIDVPSETEVPNNWYGEKFKFVNHRSDGCLQINFDKGNTSYNPSNGFNIKCTSQVNDCQELINKITNLLNNIKKGGPLSIEAIKAYEKEFSNLMKGIDTQTNLEVSLIYGDASKNTSISLRGHLEILDNIESTLSASNPFKFDLENHNWHQEGLKVITEDTIETAAIDQLPNNGEILFTDYLALAEPFLVEALIAFLPGSDIISLVRGINNNDKYEVAFALGGLIASTVGGSAIKGALKSIKVFNKITRIVRKLGTFVKAAVNAAKKGFKTGLDAAGNLILEKGGKIIARGDDATRRVLTNLADAVNDAQRNIINQWKDRIATATNKQKGNFGEMATDLDLAEKGYIPLHKRIDNIDAPGHQGIDAVMEKNGQYFIVESKFSSTSTPSLNPATSTLPKQMSDAWIQRPGELANAIGNSGLADDIIDAGYTRVLATHGPNGSIIYKLVDANGNIGGIWTP